MPGGDRTSTGDPAPGDGRWRVEHHATIDSTNREARDRARSGAEPGLVVVADHQTAGRGRLDRRWEAPPGSSLLLSVLLPAPAGPSSAHAAVVAVAVALAEAVGEVAGVDVGLKWPNDLVVGDRKLAGILAEAEGDAVVVGAGCNVNWETFPPDLAATATACNLEAGHPVDRDDVLDAFLVRLALRLDAPEALDPAYRSRLVTLGRRVRVERADDVLEGVAVDVTGEGVLAVRDDDGVRHDVITGDVVHLRDA
jgi:BirA family biotin operon repressor/biotin-[acetyl-CoA-carboxylase] ligase